MSKTTTAQPPSHRHQDDAAGGARHSRGVDAGKANTPQDDTAAAHRSGQFGADQPGRDTPAAPRHADKHPHPKGPEYEEGGQYPGTRKPGARR
ncbi:MAG: hypothetical protein NTT76_23635 [Achromobacter xylosoxidans]|nr:hypothetical protein [Achromobacter xylosoxidans]